MKSDPGAPDDVPRVPIDEYPPEALQACEKALRTIVSRVGAWGPRLILFGGLAPRYLVDAPPRELQEHTGTTDLDAVIGAEIDVDDEGVYTKLQEELKRAEFHPSENRSFAWERRVDGVRVVLEFFCQAEPDGAPGRLKRNPGGEVGSGVSAVQLKGAEIAAADCTARILSGDVLDHGGHREVEVQVVEVAKAMAILEERFAELDRKGPSKCARFFLGGRDDADEDRVRLRRDARGTVRAFLTRWKELRCSRL